ncbi:MAG: 23S rRNA (uracil(1939)-C(5))-methyltransferase RlmD [Clostridia bacterium]|nr:23S rRNA (uracil(1939)-C(5))-methyltransferase RlmD [Clostridia bacterium]
MSLSKNDDITLTIDGFTSEGSGVGHYEGMAVFVAGAAKGDTVQCHIIKAKKNYAIGKITKILTPSADRIAPDCPAFPRCGGCVYRHISYVAEKELKQQRVDDCFRRIGHLDISTAPIIGGERERYRNKAQYPVRIERGRLCIGFYAGKTHNVADCADCRLQPPEFAEILQIFRDFITKNSISVYNETTGKGLLRHIYIRKAFATGELMVTAVLNGEKLPFADALVAALTAALPAIKSIYININKENSNVVLGETCALLYGKTFIEDILCGLRIRLGPLSFYQVNHDNAEKLYALAAKFAGLTGAETLLDLYCGAGAIGLSMAHRVKKLIGVEIVPEAIKNAEENARINHIANAEFICGDAETAAAQLLARETRPDVVVVDPPRKGCGETLPATIASMAPKKIVYISCDPATLARDCATFAALGWQVQKARPVDMFPATAHCECVALLTRDSDIQ